MMLASDIPACCILKILGGYAKTTAALGHGAGDTFFATALAGNVRTDAIDIIAFDLGSLSSGGENQKQGENARLPPQWAPPQF
jgi:hypothetical protein